MTREDNGRSQALAQFASIREMVERLQAAEAGDDDEAVEAAREEIEQDALEVALRADWYSPGAGTKAEPVDYKILLCTGGPAVRIVGTVGQWNEPENARIEYQDWFTPWTDLVGEDVPDDMEEILLAYARVFYWGD